LAGAKILPGEAPLRIRKDSFVFAFSKRPNPFGRRGGLLQGSFI
jgi:hypothetical protein